MKRIILATFIISILTFFSCGEKVYKAKIETDYGDIIVELFNDTPGHRDNFIKLLKEDFYSDLLFHRVINDFMIQGGDPKSRDAGPNVRLGSGGPGYRIPNEIKHLHYRGALAMARMGGPGNPMKESSGSQFYIVQGKAEITESDLNQAAQFHGRAYTTEEEEKYIKEGGYPSLDNSYTVFGRVIKGMDVVDEIAKVQTNAMDRPVEDVKMKIRIVR
jgi:cyclophilin family peptidyl-prolyl cis-trans isomerase